MPEGATHFSCVIIHRTNDEGVVEFLVIDYECINPRSQKRSGIQIKFPGGTDADYPGEKPLTTARRELLQETLLSSETFKEVWKSAPGQYGIQYHAFLVRSEDCFGQMRKGPMNDNGDRLGEPRWVPAPELVLMEMMFRTHVEPCMAACEELGVI